MTDPFIGEIRINAFDFAPQNWAQCNGQSLPIQQYAALYSLIGSYYGKDTQNFNLPDLRGRTVVGQYTNAGTISGYTHYNMGQKDGTETVTLTVTQIPAHNHAWQAVNTAANTPVPGGGLYAQTTQNIFTTVANAANANLVALNPKIMADAGGNQPHNNMQPFLVLNFCIALLGYYPPRPW